LLYHHHFFNAGWIGVDLFFVLSGYLITSILRNTRSETSFWRGFWTKRATRILPPFLLLLVATALLRFSVSWPQALAYLFSLGDVMAYVRPKFEPLRPLWSLAVEEHFYMIWPFAVRLLRRRTLVYILLSLLLLEPIARAVASAFDRDWQFIYFLTPFRLDGLALGSLLALGLESAGYTDFIRKWSGLAAAVFVFLWFGLRISLGTGFTRDNPTAVYNSLCYTLVSLICFSLIAHLVLHPRSIVALALSWKPLIFVGNISYGLYLYQVLVRQLILRTWPMTPRTAIWIDTPIIFLVSFLSFKYYEQPCIRWGRRKAAPACSSHQTGTKLA
jgi:peptidoglycan/LPS O-acetylase OafA/YrhL